MGTEPSVVFDPDEEHHFIVPFREHVCEVTVEEFLPVRQLVWRKPNSRKVEKAESGAILWYANIVAKARAQV